MLTTAALVAALAGHAPVVVHDSRESLLLASVAAAQGVPGRGRDARPAAYGRTTRTRDGGAWLQYWLFYRGQDQDRGILRTGRHAGDWELVQYRLDAGGRLLEGVYSQHSGAERCTGTVVERRGGRPVLYAAHGSHASYFRAGVRDRIWPDPNDEANGRGAVVRPRLVAIDGDDPRWMRWPGRWGRAEARWWIPGEQDSPRGPAFQPERWNDPGAWAEAARSCQAHCDEVDECDHAEPALGGGAAAAGAGTVLLYTYLRRKRRRRRASGRPS